MKKKAIRCIGILTNRIFEIGSDPDCDKMYVKGYQDAIKYTINIIGALFGIQLR